MTNDPEYLAQAFAQALERLPMEPNIWKARTESLEDLEKALFRMHSEVCSELYGRMGIDDETAVF